MRKPSFSQPDHLDIHSISALRISIASPEQLRSWSSGEVTKAETINYRTLKPEPDGLFCERIFGPTKNWACACGKYQGIRRKGTICDKCGVQVGLASMRRSRMGHIELAAPVCHTWYARAMPSRIGLLLDLSQREIESILAYTRYIVVSVDEAARLGEIQRITAEIEHLEFSQNEAEVTYNEHGYLDAGLSEQDAVPVLVGAERIEEHNLGDGTAETSSVPDLQTILHDLLVLASFKRGEISEKSANNGFGLNGLPQQREGEESEDKPVRGQDAWEPAFQHRSIGKRIDELQRVKRNLTELVPLSLLEIEDYRLLSTESGCAFTGEIGAGALETLLKVLDLDQMARLLKREIQDHTGPTRTKAMKRLKVVEALRRSQTKPEWMVLHVIPVLPPDLRPVLALDGGRFAASDINELYSHIIHRNNRLKRFLAIGAPDLMIFREKCALQAACDALFDNGHLSHPLPGSHGRPLRSLSDSLSGKDGRFRHNLLGKRVDYSGRSVISVGLDLKIHQCGLPKKIALELFKPFVIQKLVAYRYFSTPKQAKRAVERKDPAVWDMLDEVMRDRVVLLNRAPTLHRLSIQAFEPVLIEGNAICLHPQVCSAFNADFDGDQMAVHLPISPVAQKEARELMLSTRNLLSPASGEPSISIAQEQVLGCYYLTQERPDKKGEGRLFSSPAEAIQAYNLGIIDLQARIAVRLDGASVFEQPPPAPPIQLSKGTRVQTTVGRLIFNEVLPMRLRFRNYAMKKDFLKQLAWDGIKSCGMERTAVMADEIKRLGFHYATRAAISFSITDVKVPPQKKEILAQADQRIEELSEEWRSGLITREELYKQSIDIWQEATEQVAQHVQNILDPYGSIMTIANSGATKARLQQIRQLSGMRGLMASPSGAIIETPVRGNFLEGLSVAEYFLSSHGARKSMMDRSLNTAQSGYLTIQFVNAAQEVIVMEEDCGTQEGLLITEADSRYLGLPDSSSRLIGRVLAEDLPAAGLAMGDELDEAAVERIVTARIDQLRVRSVLCCQARRGVCRKCYGWDLSRRARVSLGTAVGIIAAQSIGEPGTQLTMRTFHSGGIAGGQGDITQGIPRVKELFEARVPKAQAMISEIAGVVTVLKDQKTGGHTVQVVSTDPSASAGGEASRTYAIPPDRKLVVSSGQHIRAYDALTTGSRNPHAILHYQGREALALYLLKEAQLVYRTTGAYIHDKHFEIVIRQMLRYVQVNTPGDTQLLPGDLVDRFTYLDNNTHVVAQGGEPASARPVLLGLIRATLATESWLAAASFQQTSRVLTDAALEGRTDPLRGLKENVIIGKLIPAGTGILPRSEPPIRQIPGRRGRPAKKKV